MDAAKFKKKPVLGIMRGVPLDIIEPLIETVAAAGLETIEVTMNSPDACRAIEMCARIGGKRLSVGAGTVIDRAGLDRALHAGASFIVTPVFVKDVVEHCVKNKIPVFPGALTPKEIFEAWNAGAAMVKVFPSGFFGPAYFKEIKGPFDKIKLLACGGVTPENMASYFQNGADAVAFGSSVFKKEWLAARDFNSIGRRVKDYLSAIKNNL